MFSIIPIYFFIAILITFLFLYILTPKPTVVIKYPSINEDSPLYIDDNDVCYKYKKQEIQCPN
jgi:hypothetical protein